MPSSGSDRTIKNTFRKGFKADAERMAATCRLELGFKDCDPLSAFSLAKHLNLELATPDQIAGINSRQLKHLIEPPGCHCWSAVTLGNGQPCVIIYNNSHSSPRIESDIMHELAHVLLGHEMAEIDTSMGMPLRKYDQIQENEAEWLGGCLQLPKPALIKHFIFKSEPMEQVAAFFNASLAMVRYRIAVSGVQSLKARLKK